MRPARITGKQKRKRQASNGQILQREFWVSATVSFRVAQDFRICHVGDSLQHDVRGALSAPAPRIPCRWNRVLKWNQLRRTEHDMSDSGFWLNPARSVFMLSLWDEQALHLVGTGFCDMDCWFTIQDTQDFSGCTVFCTKMTALQASMLMIWEAQMRHWQRRAKWTAEYY